MAGMPSLTDSLIAAVRQRIDGGCTLQEIADAAGVPRTTLSAWLHRRRGITMATADAVAAAIGAEIVVTDAGTMDTEDA